MSAETAPSGLIDHVTNLSDFIWGGTWEGAEVIPVPPMVIMLLGIGLYIMIGLRFLIRSSSWAAHSPGCSPAARARARARSARSPRCRQHCWARLCTGNLAGVATAIALGGPGAVFWMWITALIGMALGFAEGSLAIRYREKTPEGNWRGGPDELHHAGP